MEAPCLATDIEPPVSQRSAEGLKEDLLTEKSLPPFLNIGGRQLDNGSKPKIDFYDNLIF